MTRAEAKQAILAGQKVTHRYFSDDEYVMLATDGSMRYEFEDGCVCTPYIFWIDRMGLAFDEDWDIWKPL